MITSVVGSVSPLATSTEDMAFSVSAVVPVRLEDN